MRVCSLGSMDTPFSKALFKQVQQHLIQHHDNILQLVGLCTLLVAVIRYKVLLVVVLFTAFSLYTAAYVFDLCVSGGCVECFFEKMVAEGVCVEIKARSGVVENTYYQCDIRTNTVGTTGLVEL